MLQMHNSTTAPVEPAARSALINDLVWLLIESRIDDLIAIEHERLVTDPGYLRQALLLLGLRTETQNETVRMQQARGVVQGEEPALT